MKNKNIFIIIAVLAIIAIIIGIFTLIPKGPEETLPDDGKEPGSDIIVNIPGDDNEDDTESDTPVEEPPEDDTDVGTTDKENNNKTESKPTVEDSSTTPTQDKTVPDTEIPEDSVSEGTKLDSAIQYGPSSGEDRNDAILEEKDKAKEELYKDIQDIIKGDENSYIDTTPKDEIIVTEESGDTGLGKNNAEFISPVTEGSNPFAQGNTTKVTDKNSDDYIGNGDRPGEGIHF